MKGIFSGKEGVGGGMGVFFGKGMESRYKDDPKPGRRLVPSGLRLTPTPTTPSGKSIPSRAPRRRSTEPRAHASTIRPPVPASVHLEGCSTVAGFRFRPVLRCKRRVDLLSSRRLMPGSDSIVAGFLGDAGGSGGWRGFVVERLSQPFFFQKRFFCSFCVPKR